MINKQQIPLSLAENRFDIISSAINKTSINCHFNNSIFFNNYSLNSPSSYYDTNTGIYYNFIKADKYILIENENYFMKMYHIIYNNLGFFFCKVSEELQNYLNKDNIYIQINNLYKEMIS
jgi:primase-polymerase (primpol)-like protein